jgi:RHS repeat-associated protein
MAHRAIAAAIGASLLLGQVQPAFAAFGDGTPTIANASVFTNPTEQSKVDGESGAFTQKIPLDIPPGRNGLQPDVSLQYNSQNTADSIVGYGWSLSVPYIQRLNKTGSQNLYGSPSYFTSSIDGELATEATSAPPLITPSIMDSLDLTEHGCVGCVSDSFQYHVPDGGSNKLFMVLLSRGGAAVATGTLNGVPLSTFTQINASTSVEAPSYYAYLANPPTGTSTFVLTTHSSGDGITYHVFTLQNAAQSNPIDVTASQGYSSTHTSMSTSTNTTVGSDLLLSMMDDQGGGDFASYGAGETEVWHHSSDPIFGIPFAGTWKAAAATPRTETMSESNVSVQFGDYQFIAVKAVPGQAPFTSALYRAKVDDGSFNSYSFSNNTWTVYDKKGTRYLYGSDDSSRQFDTGTGTSTQTYKWMLQEIRDTNGNYIKYTYNKDSNELYPSTIVYTGNGSTDGPAIVSFATSTRPDTRISFAAGFKVTTNYRISEIDAAFNNSTLRKYPLSYGVGINGKRSLLTSIQQQGYDDNGVLTSLPPTTFSYASSSTQFFSPPPISNQGPQAWTIADTNGDGINDFNNFYRNAVSGLNQEDMYIDYSTRVNNSFTPPETWATNTVPPQAVERGARYLDVNGDGKADVVRGWRDNVTPANSQSYVQLNQYTPANNTYSWAPTTTAGSIPTFAINIDIGVLTGGIFGDVNGDGLPDYESSLPGWVSPTAYLGNGSAWDATSTVFAPAKDFPVSAPAPTASQLVDVNGDGLDDWVYSDSANTYVLLNTGIGWQTSPSTQWTIATSSLYAEPGTNPVTYDDRGIRFMDINGDGLPDLVRAYQNTTVGPNACNGPEKADVKAVYLNTGNGWATSSAYTLPAYIMSCGANGNGAPMMVFNEYGNWTGNGQMYQDVLTKVNNPKGGWTNIGYGTTGGAVANPESPISLLVASQVGIYDGLGNAATTTYSYSGGKLYLASGVRDRKFAGFAISTTTAPDSVTATHYDQGDTIDTAAGEQTDGYAQINHPFRKDVFDLSNNLKQRTYLRWDTISHGSSTAVVLGRQMVEDFATDGTHRDKATDYSYSPTTDDIISTVQYGEVTGNSDGTFTDTGNDTRTTNISYAASSAINLSTPVEKTMLDANGATISDQKLYYDGLSFGQVSLGNNTREEGLISGGTYASSTKTYNSFGLVATSTDRNGNATSYVYDAYNLFPATTTNALLQTTQAYYNYANGKAKQTVDPNSRLTKSLFDGIGRPIEMDQSDLITLSSYATSTAYQYTDNTTTPSIVRRTDYLNAASTTDTFDFSDGLGRLIQERRSSQTAGVYDAFDKLYNPAGELSSQSLPYFSSGNSLTSATTTSLLFTNYTYDPLQRVLTNGNIVGTSTNSYAKWTTSSTDPNGNIKDYVLDAFGNLATVVEHNTTIATTSYSYDPLNDLATTTDALGNVRGFTYDGLGRRLTAQDLHFSTDTTFGIWNYTYDAQGNLTSQTDPKNQVVNRTYDALNRMLTEDYMGQSGTEVTLTYDNCTSGIGSLCMSSSTDAKTTNAYDILGRTTSATTTVKNSSYNMGYAYDRQGNITSLTYPSSSQVSVAYNLAGLPNRIQRKPSGGSFNDIVSSLDYSPAGQVTTTVFGNGASTTRTYNGSAMYRLSQLRTRAQGGTKVQDFAYTYDPVGNITLLNNTANSTANATTLFTYDALNRLLLASTTAAASTPYSNTYSYDSLGNMLSILNGGLASSSPPSTSTYTYGNTGFANPDAVTQIANGLSTTTYAYDNNGNLISRGTGTATTTYTYDYANRLISLFAGGATTTYVYDAFGQRVLQAGTSTSTIYPFKWYSVASSTNSSTSTDYIFNGDSLLATVDNSSSSGAGGGGPTDTGQKTAGTVNVTGNWSNLTVSQIATSDDAWASCFASCLTAGQVSNFTFGVPSGAAISGIAVTVEIHCSGLCTSGRYAGVAPSLSWNNGTTFTSSKTATTTSATDIVQTFGGASDTWGRTWNDTEFASSTFRLKLAGANSQGTVNVDQVQVRVYYTPSGGSTSTSTSVVSYIHPDHLGSTNVVTDKNGAVVQTLDYFPYGGTRVSASIGGADSGRKYIGQFADQSGLDYLNARYYNSSQGQFISQDPVFLGDPKQQTLQDPQSLNSYSYSNDNPISKKDPTGRWWEISASGVEGGIAGAAGLRFDGNELLFFSSAAKGTGDAGGIQVGWAPGKQLSNKSEVSTSVNAEVGVEGLGVRESRLTTWDTAKKDQPGENSLESEYFFGEGGGISTEVETTYPLFCWGCTKSAPIASKTLGAPQMVNKLNLSTAQSKPATSQWQFGVPNSSSNLPAAVSQNGITYVRNSSGLLNTAK